MRLRQEQIVFLFALLIFGYLGWSMFAKKKSVDRTRRGGAQAEFVSHDAPPVEIALRAPEKKPSFARELFAPPRDTRPLPPLDLVEPPRERLAELLPPTVPGPAPDVYGRLLRIRLEPVEVPDLFAGEEEGDDFVRDGSPQDGADGEVDDEAVAVLESLGYLGQVADEQDGERSSDKENLFAEETPAERFARIEGYKDRFDWILRAGSLEPDFGRIENENRYELDLDTERSTEAILFLELDPETGEEIFANVKAGAIPRERDLIEQFGFARTPANEIELRRRRIGAGLTRGSYEEALALADDCIRYRLDAERALAMAEELYELCSSFDSEDPAPRLGLARCFEAGFDFERAFKEYESLLERFEHRPEVHVRLAQLEERFLLFEQAEERLQKVLGAHRGSWEARWGLGRFLLNRARHAEAIEHLAEASRSAPQDPSLRRRRVEIRTDLASAYFGAGDVESAQRVFLQALSADDSHQEALAGLIGTQIVRSELEGLNGELVGDDEEASAGFELLLARGIAQIVQGDYELARDQLQLAGAADPLRVHHALGALAFLADLTGHPEDALRFAEEALEIAPRDAYALYLRGRLLGRADEYEDARASLLEALEVELDFEDALVALGEMAFRLGRFEDAERYFERAVAINPSRPEVHALRGLNLLRLTRVADARDSFERSLEEDSSDPVGRCGLAWCTYLAGESEEALIQLGNLDEARRAQPEDDPYRVWAKQQIERIQDHEEKLAWTDNFNRKRLINGWQAREGVGPLVGMEEGSVKIEGLFDQQGRVLVYRTLPSSLFVSFEADVWVDARSNVRAGAFIARERERQSSTEMISEASVSRQKEGALQVRFLRSGREPEITDMEQRFPTGEWVRLRVERKGESNDSRVTVSMDGIPLMEDVSFASVGRAATPLLIGLFAEGEQARQVLVRMDNAEVVYRQ